ncbi:MAG: carboxypeptidase-like regulatory domain-containing protein [archaeon GB-1867-005]|nr:carboxypeptidase-like regulatory domain-containing protein [Candidatus Culexmicrobium cathedralense]
MNKAIKYTAALLIIACILIVLPAATVKAQDEEVLLALCFVDQAGKPLENAYVEVWNITGEADEHYILFTGRTNEKGWLNVTLPGLLDTTSTKYNMTVKWDPAYTDAFTVYENSTIYGNELSNINETNIYTSVWEVNLTATDYGDRTLKYHKVTFYYNYTDKIYSVSGYLVSDDQSLNLTARIPIDVSWSKGNWTLKVYWDYEYLVLRDVNKFDGTIVEGYSPEGDIKEDAVILKISKPTEVGAEADIEIPSEGVGYFNVSTDVYPLYITLYDWLGNPLKSTTSGYSIVKVSLNDKENPEKLLATALATENGEVSIDQYPNVPSVLTVYWLTHEIQVNTTILDDPSDYSDDGLKVYCQLVPFNVTLLDKRPTAGKLLNAKVVITWPNLISFNTRSDESEGLIQLPPLVSEDPPTSKYVTLTGRKAAGYIPFGDTKIEVYWSITPEDPASWVKVKSVTFTVENASTTYGAVDFYVDEEIVKDDYDQIITYNLVCEVYDAHLTVVDLNGNPLPNAVVVLEHPSGAVSTVPATATGTLTLIQVPGGVWHVGVVYKNLHVKPYGMSDIFNVTDNIYEAVAFKFAFVDAKLRMVKWGTDDYGIAGINVTLSWEGNATITGDTGTWTEDWNTTNGYGWANFTQIPAGIEITIKAYTHEDKHKHFGGKDNVYVGPYENKLTLAAENYTGTHHVYIYDFILKLLDITGNEMPEVLPYANASIAVHDFEEAYGNTTAYNSIMFYSINGSHLFVGGQNYTFEIYWAGVRVFNGTGSVHVPLVTDPDVVNPVATAQMRVYPVTFELYDWKHSKIINSYNLMINVSWLGLNMTWLNASEDYRNVIPEDKAYAIIFSGNDYSRGENAYVYNITIIVPDETLVYIPVWSIKDVNGTPITITINTIAGTTKDAPAGTENVTVGCLTTSGEFINGSSTFKDKPVVKDLPYWSDYGVYNFTGFMPFSWGEVWSYDNVTRVFDFKLAAYNMTAVVKDWRGEGLAGYTVKVYWTSPLSDTANVFVASSTTNENGVARFDDTVFWGNETKYLFKAYYEPKPDELPSAIYNKTKIADDVKANKPVDVKELAEEGKADDHQVQLTFDYYIGVQMLSSTGRPLYHDFGTVKRALVYAVRYRAYGDADAGTVAAFGWVDEHGYVYLPFAADDGKYTIRTQWLGVNVYDSYEKEMTEYKIVSPTVFYTAFTDVYDVTIKLTDDVNRPLKGVFYTFVGAGDIDYMISGNTGVDGTFTALLVPKGDYILSAKWTDGVIDILTDYKMTIDKNIVELPIKCRVYDVMFNLKTKRGTIMTAADVTVKYPDGTEHSATTDQNGEILFTQVPVGTLEVVSVTWMGRPITVSPNSVDVDKTGTYYFTSTNVYLLTVVVKGARGQGLGPSTVTISPVEMEVVTDESGVVTVELPEGSYTIHVNYRGIEDEKSITLTGDMTEEFRLDVFATILGRPFRTAEFFGEVVLLPIVVAIIVYLVAYEYYAWRRRRVAVVPPPTPT